MTLAIGIRSLVSDEGLPELLRQAADARKEFPEAKLVLAACGMEPPEGLSASFDKVVHYSNKAEGYGKPWALILAYAEESGCDDVIVTNGNDQHIFAEVRKAYEKAQPGVVVPERMKRVVFMRDTIDGQTLEDLENGFIRHKWSTGIRDLQSGLFILKGRNSWRGLREGMEKLDSWLGDLAFYDLLFSRNHNAGISTPKIIVRSQHYSLSSRLFVFRTIASCEQHFGISFQDLVKEALNEPFAYLFDGSPARVEEIENAYLNYRNAEKVRGMKALILAAGKGTNLRPITDTRLKPVVPIANKPIIEYIVEELLNAGINDIGIVVSPAGGQIRQVVGDGSRWKARITYITQPEPLGLAHAVRCAQGYIGDSPFVLYLGDTMLSGGISEFVSSFAASSDEAKLMLTVVDDPSRFGVVELDSKKRPVRLVEKPKNPATNFAVVGVYAFRQGIFGAIAEIKPSARGELEITDAIQKLIDDSRPISVEFVKDWWHDTGRPQSLLLANGLVLDHMKDTYNEGTVAKGSKVFGRVRIGKGTKILGNTEIRGPVVIGKDCTIGPDCFIGPYTSIGDGTEISGTRMEFSMVFDKADIRDAGAISDSIIGSGCRVVGKGKSEAAKTLVLGDGTKTEA